MPNLCAEVVQKDVSFAWKICVSFHGIVLKTCKTCCHGLQRSSQGGCSKEKVKATGGMSRWCWWCLTNLTKENWSWLMFFSKIEPTIISLVYYKMLPVFCLSCKNGSGGFLRHRGFSRSGEFWEHPFANFTHGRVIEKSLFALVPSLGTGKSGSKLRYHKHLWNKHE